VLARTLTIDKYESAVIYLIGRLIFDVQWKNDVACASTRTSDGRCSTLLGVFPRERHVVLVVQSIDGRVQSTGHSLVYMLDTAVCRRDTRIEFDFNVHWPVERPLTSHDNDERSMARRHVSSLPMSVTCLSSSRHVLIALDM
jgi:hypothetical protein